jgi:DNA gyrase subunit A
MNLDKGDRVLAVAVADDEADLMVVTGNGYGKRTAITEYPRKGRPTKGVRTIKVSDKKGELITARIVRPGQQLLLVSVLGQVIRIEVGSVKKMGRSTEGVRLMDVGDEDQVVTCAPVDEQDDTGVDDDVATEDEVTEGEATEDIAADDTPTQPDAE